MLSSKSCIVVEYGSLQQLPGMLVRKGYKHSVAMQNWQTPACSWGNPDTRFIQNFTCFFINFIGCVGVRTRRTGWRALWLMDARSTKGSLALWPAYRAVFPPNKRLTEQSAFTSWPFGKAGKMQSDLFHIKFVCDNEMGVDCWCAASQQPFFL